jgi:apolipoprotein D and lipocalin family protein
MTLGAALAAAMLSSDILIGQSVSAVPTLDFDQFTGSWYEVARFPNKREKICTGDVVEVIALGDKAKQLQIVTSCKTNKGYTEVRNATARTENKRGDGELKVTFIWPFSEKDWVIGVGPDAQWVLIGNPNHKALWVYSRTATLSAAVLSDIEQRANAAGFATAKLVMTPQSGR